VLAAPLVTAHHRWGFGARQHALTLSDVGVHSPAGRAMLVGMTYPKLARRTIRALSFLALAACGGSVTSEPPLSASSSSGGSSGSSGGAGKECTAIGCVDGLTLRLAAQDGWKQGTYVFALDIDGVEQTCKGALPLPSCGQRGLSCDNTLAQLGESGCALPASEHAFSDIQIRSAPARVKIRIERDGIKLADEVITPSYRTSQPNGPDCGPVCTQASAAVTL